MIGNNRLHLTEKLLFLKKLTLNWEVLSVTIDFTKKNENLNQITFNLNYL